MDKLKNLALQGIKRNNPQGADDGACDELINLRPDKGAWRPIGTKEVLYDDPDYDKIFIHSQDDIENWIGYNSSSKQVIHYNPSTLGVTQTVCELESEEEFVQIKFLKLYMLIATTKKMYKFLYKQDPDTGTYSYLELELTGIEDWFDVELSNDYAQEVTSTDISEEGGGTAGLYGKYLELVNDLSDESRFHGGVFTRFALRLYDGSYILHSIPRFHQFGNYTAYLKRSGGQQFRWVFNTDGDQATIQLTGSSGSAVITTKTEEGTQTKTITYSSSLINTASAFVSANAVYYATQKITLTASGSKLIFATTSNTPQDTPTITNSTDNLSGTIECESAFNELLAKAVFDDRATITKFEEIKDVVDAIVLFSSQNQSFWDFDNEEDYSDFLTIVPTEEDIVNVDEFLEIKKEFKEDMFDGTAWYKIGEIPLNELTLVSGTRFEADMNMDMDGFYQDYATRETLPIDNFTHHVLTANANYVYNDRLTLGDILLTLCNPFLKDFTPSTTPEIGAYSYSQGGSIDLMIQVYLETGSGASIVEQELSVTEWYQSGGLFPSASKKVIFFPNVIGYPDSRAKSITIYISNGGWYELASINLKKSVFGNYSYAVIEDFSKTDMDSDYNDQRQIDKNFNSYYIQYQYSSLTPSNPKTTSIYVKDSNRVQFSEVANPFVFPAENSQQVGNGVVMAFGTNTEPVGVSQFGQFPIIVFTSVGRWIFEIGTGDVYILSVRPLDGEVIRDNYATLDLSFGVAYITSDGLKISRGKEVFQISENVEGQQDPTFIDNLNFQYFINLEQTVQMSSYVDKVPFLTYLVGASIGYNKGSDKNEIIVANPDYYYAYVYDMDTKSWHKISGSYRIFIPNYPELYAVRTKITGLLATESDDLVNMSSEVSGNTQIMMVTRAISFDNYDVFKKLRRTFMRGYMNATSLKQPAMYIFKSDDLKTWTYVTGNDQNTGEFMDIWVTHSMNSARFYIFVVTADLAVSSSVINRINGFQTEYQIKMGNKLR